MLGKHSLQKDANSSWMLLQDVEVQGLWGAIAFGSRGDDSYPFSRVILKVFDGEHVMFGNFGFRWCVFLKSIESIVYS